MCFDCFLDKHDARVGGGNSCDNDLCCTCCGCYFTTCGVIHTILFGIGIVLTAILVPLSVTGNLTSPSSSPSPSPYPSPSPLNFNNNITIEHQNMTYSFIGHAGDMSKTLCVFMEDVNDWMFYEDLLTMEEYNCRIMTQNTTLCTSTYVQNTNNYVLTSNEFNQIKTAKYSSNCLTYIMYVLLREFQ